MAASVANLSDNGGLYCVGPAAPYASFRLRYSIPARDAMLRVGLTGGVACGKSAVGAMLAEREAHYLQADTLAHHLYAPGQATYESVVEHFGREILNPDGTINRGRLANAAFPARIAELNAIVHPAVVAAQNRWMDDVERADPNGIAVVEAALIVEAGASRDFDKLIVVTCNLEQKVERYAQRAKISLEEARKEVQRRSAAQLSDEEKASRADYVIDNSGTIADTARQVESVWQKLRTTCTH
jgi:dephospho-CoA kinase